MERYIQHLIAGAEQRTANFLAMQVKDKQDLQYGGLRSNVWEAKPTIYALAAAVAVWLNPDSRYHKDPALYDTICLALDFVARTQREDGSFDYPTCNFHPAPDTSFCFKRLFATHRILVKYDDGSQQIAGLRQRYLALMHKALPAIRDGGFHTPNHRWGIAAALLQGANLFADETDFARSLRDRAGQYLAEGIDGDEDGEYAERSTGNYNAVVNNAMMAMYQATGDDKFLGYVRRNLSMMLTYIDPDGTVFTQNSTRQDQGKLEYADKYFYQYLYMCSHEENEVFDAAAQRIIRDNMTRGDIAPDCLHIIMAHDEMLHHHFTHCGFPAQYRKFFHHAGVLRVQNPQYTYTVLNGKSAFLYFKSGSTMIYLKIGESYCDIRNFIPQTIEVGEGRCTLKATAKGWYYLPFQEPPATSDWWQMDHASRDKLISSQLTITLDIVEQPDGLDLHLKTEGLDRLPLRVEFCVPADTVLDHPAFNIRAQAGSGLILRDGTLTVRDGAKHITIGPGFGEHEFQGHYSGEEVNTAGFTVYCNAYTPTERKLSIRVNHDA